MTGNIVIVGGGQAGFAVAAKLRALGDARPVTILAAEASLPYQRPPLSKKYLLREMSLDRLFFRPQEWFDDNAVEVRLSTRATGIDREARTVTLSTGETLAYGTLVLATGATPRRLPAEVGGDLAGVTVLRDFADADALAGEMQPGRRVLIVGGGYIGLEAAAVARSLGLEVTLIEMADRILNRVASAATADLLRAVHLSRGVDIRENTGLVRLEGRDGRVVAAHLTDGTRLDIDLVIAGIGVLANDALAREAGLETAGGIVVDAFGRTADPAIFAAGDVAVFDYDGARIRLESVQNAVDQAEAVAAVIAGGTAAYRPHPWFWSDQFDIKLQIAGLGRAGDETVLRPGQREGSVSVWYFRDGHLKAVDAINDAKAYVTAKKLLELGRSPSIETIRDTGIDLKTLIA
ncbi:FAD-dependent oxidoreductase [Rhizobium sp. RU20A]|uniref:NAD(P)/FAD-dependent oxidoreductase n=1 Tax=Rhizobium sp. RU20A TaxID=1907412 RepID=UPI00122D1D3E|nr:FAD-dependent oxidoreductase [Rhizobium sp. RU20A]